MINRTLFKVGCKPSLKGFLPLQYSIIYAMEHDDIRMGKLYQECAEIYGGNWHAMERRMRHCIRQAYNIRNITKWDEVFPTDICPSTKEFISYVVFYIKNKQEEEKCSGKQQ